MRSKRTPPPGMWSAREAARAWGVSRRTASTRMRRISGFTIIGDRLYIPAGFVYTPPSKPVRQLTLRERAEKARQRLER